MQPFWSNFTVGDTSLLQHKPGDENPKFKPKAGLVHIPSAAKLRADKKAPGLDLTYGGEGCRITVQPKDDKTLTLVCEASCKSDKPVEGHVVFLPRLGTAVTCASGKSTKLGDATFAWSAADLGAWFEHGGVRVSVPPGAQLAWPKKRHSPYTKDGHSELRDARLVLCLPFAAGMSKREVVLEIAK
jgi:hypothetical protein